MAKKTTEEAPKFFKIPTSTNEIEVGTVPMELLVQRRNNFRKMTRQQKAALKMSLDATGMQSFIQVVRNSDGTFSIVDGHHRRDELIERGAKVAPVIVLPEMDEQTADKLMLTFNVSAELIDDEFTKLMRDMLDKGIEKSEIATAAVVSEALLDELQKSLEDVEPPDVVEDDLPRDVKVGTKAGKKPPKIKVLILSPTGPDVDGLILAATHADTVITNEVRESVAAAGYSIDEAEPVWVEDGLALVEGIS